MSSINRGDISALVAGSRIYATCDRARAAIVAAARRSATSAFVNRANAQWASWGWQRRRLVVGTILIVAPLTHVALQLVAADWRGSTWLLIPALAAAAGAINLVTVFLSSSIANDQR